MWKVRNRIIAVCCAAALVLASFSGTIVKGADEIDYSKPLLTIACLSDLHNQGPILTEDNSEIRGTISSTIDQMLDEEENVDAVVIGGDVTSDNQTTEDKLYRILDMVQEKVSRLSPNTLWITGNHDFNAGGSDYNSAEYYERFVSPNMGELSGNDIYIESYNGVDYVCGYHYVINGFDILCLLDSYEILEGSKQHSNYVYSGGTLYWLEDKLEDIEYYREESEKDKPIFIVAHFPFNDSNSLSSPSKGMVKETNDMMKSILSQYDNVYYLYGHDHGTDTAYIRTDTAQRVTEYDTDGNVINSENDMTTTPDDDSEQPPSVADKSFTTVFMGSMRYYNNSIDGWVNEKSSKVVQALMVYVYYDRIEFVMKNYGTQDAGSWELKPYIVNKQTIPYPTEKPTVQPNISQTSDTSHNSNGNNQMVLPTAQAGIPSAGEPGNQLKLKKAVIKKINAKKGMVTVKRLAGVKKYQIQVSAGRKFKKKGLISKIFSGTRCTIKKLKKGRVYYIRVRAYKSSDKNIKPGAWSRIKRLRKE